jgi:hypothetical protein
MRRACTTHGEKRNEGSGGKAIWRKHRGKIRVLIGVKIISKWISET